MSTPQFNCPQCQQPTLWQDNPWRPFCCQRCRLIDLGDWLDERHSIAGREQPQDDEE